MPSRASFYYYDIGRLLCGFRNCLILSQKWSRSKTSSSPVKETLRFEVNIEASTMFSDSFQMPCWHVWAEIRVRCVGDFFPFDDKVIQYTFFIVLQDDILWLNSSTISKAERNQINHLQKKMCGFVLKATNQQSRKSGTRFCGQLCQWWNTKICIKDASMHFCEKKS